MLFRSVEPFIATEMSPANREQMTECLESVWHRILADVSDSRRIPTDNVNEELWKLGVSSKTQHNEVAPAQH